MPSAFYVDLDVAGTGGAGTQGDPWTWLDFYAEVSAGGGALSADDTVFLRGEKDITDSPSGPKSFWQVYRGQFELFNMSAWDLSAYGPWRIYDTDNRIHLNGVYRIHGGLVQSDYERTGADKTANRPSISINAFEVENCLLRGESIAIRSFVYTSAFADVLYPTGGGYCSQNYCGGSSATIDIRGCTIICDKDDNLAKFDFDLRVPTVVTIKDSIVYISEQQLLKGRGPATTPTSAVSAVYDWVATSAASVEELSGTGINAVNTSASSNMQYSWQREVDWPNWDDEEPAFWYSILGQGITISGSGEW